MRKVLLVEPDYKNKYPPMGLMKLATYYRSRGDDVRFYKGNLKHLAVDLICEELLTHLRTLRPNVFWSKRYPILFEFIKLGRHTILEADSIFQEEQILTLVKAYRQKYKLKDYFENPTFDKVAITTLFTFYWKKTIDTINFTKRLCKREEDVMVGGIMSTLLPQEVFEATGIRPHIGLLDKPRSIDEDDERIIDQLSLDYSILDEIDYVYPANNAYFAYMTRGCVNKCPFCAVPTLEPTYCGYISLRAQIDYTRAHFGEQKDLLLMDNNVLASNDYNKIIDEIVECGFGTGEKYTSSKEYDIAIKNLWNRFNDRAYIKKTVRLYHKLLDKLEGSVKRELYLKLEIAQCLQEYTATRDKILSLDTYVRPLYNKTFKPSKRKRVIDFNQGIEARLVTDEKMGKLALTNIHPLRIAFDHWKDKELYSQAVRLAVRNGVKKLSNYMLYNYQDKPEELYFRMRLTVELCEELDASIYSFPMKYHPIDDPKFFMNRNYIGPHWNRKFIRAVQAILNSTKGKIGKGISFFEEAFGSNVDAYRKLLWMPETFIVYRRQYNRNLRDRLAAFYPQSSGVESDLANEWWLKFNGLNENQLNEAKSIIALNRFKEGDYNCEDPQVEDVLNYYKITRSIAENMDS